MNFVVFKDWVTLTNVLKTFIKKAKNKNFISETIIFEHSKI